ncbi:MAG: imidazole glycerol phosphate synthase subunit HisH [Cyanobacteria bacterium J06638_7]
MIRLGLIDYGMGNLHSVRRAFERLGAEVLTVADPGADGALIESCRGLVLPGVGAFDPAMERLRASGLDRMLGRWCAQGKPLLGICLGLQLLFEASDEGQSRGLALLPGRVRALPRRRGHPIPHMGWEPLVPLQASPLLPANAAEAWVYFVHSFAAEPSDPAIATAGVDFAGDTVTAAVWSGAVGACQFHPEKSGQAGAAILRRWLQWLPA